MTKYLFFLYHSYNGHPSNFDSIDKLIKQHFPNSEVYRPVVLKGLFSAPKLIDLVEDLLNQVDEEYEQFKMHNIKIIFIGHSLGALLARKVYIYACGTNPETPLEKALQPREWASKVDRVILFAGMNNGWKLNYQVNFKYATQLRLGLFIMLFFSVKRTPLILKFRRNGEAITRLKLESIAMQKNVPHKGVGNAPIIQLLGTIDDLVSPDDNIDLVSGKNFIYLEMPYSGHVDVIDLTNNKKVKFNNESCEIGEIRSKILLKALKNIDKELKPESIEISKEFEIIPNPLVTDVVFIVHGIRDKGYWTKKIGQRILKESRKQNLNGKCFEIETTSYGYFPMLNFLLPSIRRSKVEWLMEQYAKNSVMYPNAEFSFIGHSNGTYILSKALKEYPLCRFKHVFFAGSVVNHYYDWKKMIQDRKVNHIYNIVASQDYVVGIFPNALRFLRFTALGAAGYVGFKPHSTSIKGISQFISIKGGHGEAISETYWDHITHFILTGNIKNDLINDSDESKYKINGLLAFLIILILVLLLIGIGYLILKINSITLKILIETIYLFLVWKILTRF